MTINLFHASTTVYAPGAVVTKADPGRLKTIMELTPPSALGAAWLRDHRREFIEQKLDQGRPRGYHRRIGACFAFTDPKFSMRYLRAEPAGKSGTPHVYEVRMESPTAAPMALVDRACRLLDEDPSGVDAAV